jgi:hypothetical protein
LALAGLLASVEPALGPMADAAPSLPGMLVSIRSLQPDDLIPGATKGFRIVYTTTGQNGTAEVSGGDVYLPGEHPPAGGWRVVSWGHGTTGITFGCAPNLTGGITGPISQTPYLSQFLDAGYAVAATDYIGLGAPGVNEYQAGRAEGHAVLDIVRAAHRLDPAISTTAVSAGHSQGGHAALFAAAIAQQYAPDIDVRGSLAYAPTSHAEDIITHLMGPAFPTLPIGNDLQLNLILILAGLDHARPDLDVDGYLSDRGRQVLAIARKGSGCLTELKTAVHGQALGTLLSRPLSDPALVAALQDYMAVPVHGYRAPITLEQGVVDDMLPAPLTVTLAQQLSTNTSPTRLQLYPTANHFTILSQASADALGFLNEHMPPTGSSR